MESTIYSSRRHHFEILDFRAHLNTAYAAHYFYSFVHNNNGFQYPPFVLSKAPFPVVFVIGFCVGIKISLDNRKVEICVHCFLDDETIRQALI